MAAGFLGGGLDLSRLIFSPGGEISLFFGCFL
jgi:hypothetical protein